MMIMTHLLFFQAITWIFIYKIYSTFVVMIWMKHHILYMLQYVINQYDSRKHTFLIGQS